MEPYDLKTISLGLRTGMGSKQLALYASYANLARRPGETDAQLRERISMSGYMTRANDIVWLDGISYPTEAEKGRFGRIAEIYNGWGELRRQKKPPHTQVLYVWTKKYAIPGPNQVQTLVLRSINNCSNDQLRESIQLAAVRLEQHQITQTEAESILDRCYAELQRRMEWTDREKAKRNGPSQENQGPTAVDSPT